MHLNWNEECRSLVYLGVKQVCVTSGQQHLKVQFEVVEAEDNYCFIGHSLTRLSW